MREASLLPAWALLVIACSGGLPPSDRGDARPRAPGDPADARPAGSPAEQRVTILGAACGVVDWVTNETPRPSWSAGQLAADCEVTLQGKPALLSGGQLVRVYRDGSPMEVPLARPLSLQVGGRDIVFVRRLGLHPSGAVAWGQLAEETDVITAAGVLRAAALPYDVSISFLPDGAVQWLRLVAPVELQVGETRILACNQVELDPAGRLKSTVLGRSATLAGATLREHAFIDLEWDESGRLSSAREQPRLER